MKLTTWILPLMLSIGWDTSSAQEIRQPPPRPRETGGRERRPPREGRQSGGYSLEQAVSDRAQLHTIAFSGLAFLTGDWRASTFIPPGKVADFFGFQYLRDIDAAGKGHNPMFLDRIAGNVMRLLAEPQRRIFEAEAKEEAILLESIARKRLPLVAAFHQELSGNLPKGCEGLDHAAVRSLGADLFDLDARLAWHRAKAFGAVARSLSTAQRQVLGSWKFGDFRTWPEVDREDFRDLRPRGATKLESVAYMTLASEFFSWVAGSLEADTYFCPERHGTYFGGFYLKDMPAMGQKDFDISTSLTGDAGEAFLEALTPPQRARMEAVIGQQRETLRGIVAVRREISTRLRGFLTSEGPSEAEIRTLGRRYGELEGELAYLYATTFTAIQRSLDAGQRARLQELRGQPSRESGTAFLYSDRIPMTQLPDTFFLLGGKEGGK